MNDYQGLFENCMLVFNLLVISSFFLSLQIVDDLYFVFRLDLIGNRTTFDLFKHSPVLMDKAYG